MMQQQHTTRRWSADSLQAAFPPRQRFTLVGDPIRRDGWSLRDARTQCRIVEATYEATDGTRYVVRIEAWGFDLEPPQRATTRMLVELQRTLHYRQPILGV